VSLAECACCAYETHAARSVATPASETGATIAKTLGGTDAFTDRVLQLVRSRRSSDDVLDGSAFLPHHPAEPSFGYQRPQLKFAGPSEKPIDIVIATSPITRATRRGFHSSMFPPRANRTPDVRDC